jgi:glutathione synthase/RimK-type ligase-like ATP-grasp enzyme
MRLDIQAPQGLRPLAHKAVEALGYDFGAVDILDAGPETDERFVVLEVNSAPALLSEHTRNKYLTAIKERR